MTFPILIRLFLLAIFVKYTYGKMDITTETITTTTEADPSVVPPVYQDQVKFYLFTSKYYTQKETLLNPNKSETYNFLSGKIYFFMHGWKEVRERVSWFKDLTELLLHKYPYANVIQIDWRKPADYHYNVSFHLMPVIAELTGTMAAKIYKCNDKSKEIVFLGNSIGGQLVSFAAKKFKAITGRKISRIISLDPAGLFFNTSTPDRKLIPEDAENVMVLHTDQIFGIGNVRTGHIDFYANGGIIQPGCPPIKPYNLTIIRPPADDPIWCPHTRANLYFVEAVRAPEHFLARKCKDYRSFQEGICENIEVSLGDLETTRRGTFFLDTAGQPPFYRRRIDTLKKRKRPPNN